ncbi:MAG: hypothetical protein A2W85_03280 [Bacteroidetes bacterium GWF2_41_31]|nr:MAG: hypothetical protein A2W85_03280 [Bacteroidetes bacterium GWF2_41_31]OFZ04958.1 MAG: hypothetical protein A2338_10080 [Bacteroidetes bacterium RIFOXYB12_FULL_41_6]
MELVVHLNLVPASLKIQTSSISMIPGNPFIYLFKIQKHEKIIFFISSIFTWNEQVVGSGRMGN